jgi:hypothetical protein
MRLSSAVKTWRLARLEWLLVALIITAGFTLRVAHLDAKPFWCDEAESSINALTILQHGYPADSYLGLPIYENTLVRPWAGNPEYEFKDISYSDKGMAVYHGWLPLYALAASFALHQVKPEQPNSSLDIRYTLEESRRLTWAGRIPSVLFGLVFLVIAFAGGNAFYGKDAGWIALVTATMHPWHISLSREARYYSATVALSTGCCLLVWLMITKGRWRDFVLGAILFVLLFHTHLLSFVSASSIFALAVPVILYRRRLDLKKIAAFGLIVAAGTVPWVIITEFYRHQSRIPRGWSLLSLPADFIPYLPLGPMNIIIGLTFLLFLLWLNSAKSHVPDRLRTPLLRCFFPTLFLAAWTASGYLSFLLGMPAASFFSARLNLSYWGAVLLLGSVICASIVRAVMPRLTAWRVALGLLLMMAIVRPHGFSFMDNQATGKTGWSNIEQVIGQLDVLKLRKETKLYATPNDHLVLTFYTGLPFQSIAPVRKSFLDRYPGDVVIVQSLRSWRSDSLAKPEKLQVAALRAGKALSRPEAEQLSAELLTRDYQQTVIRNVTGVATSTMEGMSPFARTAWQAYRAQASEAYVSLPREDPWIMTRGFSIANWPDCMDVFFYRFVNPDSRRGSNRNDVQRLRGAKAYVLIPSGFVVFYSRGGSTPGESAGVDFTFVRQVR